MCCVLVRTACCMRFHCIPVYRICNVYLACRFLKNLQIIVSTVLHSIPALGSIVMLISLVLCILPFNNCSKCLPLKPLPAYIIILMRVYCTMNEYAPVITMHFSLSWPCDRYICHHWSRNVRQSGPRSLWQPSASLLHSLSAHHAGRLVLHVLRRTGPLPR